MMINKQTPMDVLDKIVVDLQSAWGSEYKVEYTRLKKELVFTISTIEHGDWKDEYIRFASIRKDNIVTAKGLRHMNNASKITRKQLELINKSYEIIGW